MTLAIKLLYPEQRYVTEGIIQGWYSDAIANGDVCAPFITDNNTNAMIDELEDGGLIAVCKRQHNDNR